MSQSAAQSDRAAAVLEGLDAEQRAVATTFGAPVVVLATGGDGAVLRGMDGSVGLLLPLADGWIARRLPPSALDWTGGGLVARLDEPMMRRVTLNLPARPDWLAA